MYKKKIPMALATITFPTTIFYFFLGILLRNTKEIINFILLGGKKNRVNKKNKYKLNGLKK